MFKLALGEEDFVDVYGRDKIDIELGKNIPVLGSEADRLNGTEILEEMLPAVVARKIEKIMPKGYSILEIEVEISIEGKPFGFGIGGSATVRFGPKSV